ncbi:ABC transporter ATP-binding protein [Streptomyces hoynatensis]|uniref:ABC transporter ATP-binding protein n=1 Tax=Streptomyces hoynatensis TaxID=1141874 RepID=A0A3A9YLK1_9ACTN|nr:ABC transporter ATP-binding protein [Streptomyces hoynatensis]RKN37099.1 ABC transporter ATP-binding protein [Streptomyces hoynatensis]
MPDQKLAATTPRGGPERAAPAADRVVVDRVSKDFELTVGRRRQHIRALNEVSLTVADGEIIALTGLSGCGKTTLLRIIMGLEKATSGGVSVGGQAVTGCGYDRGLVFQHAELFPWRTALQNVEFGLEVKGVPKPERRRIAREKLALVGLGHAMDRRPSQLSGGMKQRVGLARALSIDPQVLLMDEPFGALDAQTREGLQAEVLRIHRETGKTIVFVTHDLDEAVLLAHRVVLMSPNPGRVKRVFEVPIEGSREDLVAVRGTETFAELRYEIWRSLMEHAPEEEPARNAVLRAAGSGAERSAGK